MIITAKAIVMKTQYKIQTFFAIPSHSVFEFAFLT